MHSRSFLEELHAAALCCDHQGVRETLDRAGRHEQHRLATAVSDKTDLTALHALILGQKKHPTQTIAALICASWIISHGRQINPHDGIGVTAVEFAKRHIPGSLLCELLEQYHAFGNEIRWLPEGEVRSLRPLHRDNVIALCHAAGRLNMRELSRTLHNQSNHKLRLQMIGSSNPIDGQTAMHRVVLALAERPAEELDALGCFMLLFAHSKEVRVDNEDGQSVRQLAQQRIPESLLLRFIDEYSMLYDLTVSAGATPL